jgi:hypothetical protein
MVGAALISLLDPSFGAGGHHLDCRVRARI